MLRVSFIHLDVGLHPNNIGGDRPDMTITVYLDVKQKQTPIWVISGVPDQTEQDFDLFLFHIDCTLLNCLTAKIPSLL